MELSSLRANSFRSLLDADVPIGVFNLFIGANASGKSTILDALRFLSEAVSETPKGFAAPWKRQTSGWGNTTKRGDLVTDVSKRVVIIASGETERRSLPYLLAHLATEEVIVEDVRIPPRHRPINVDIAAKIIRSVSFERVDDTRPHKFVVLLDTDASLPEVVVAPIRADLPARLRDIDASIQFAYAQPYLEAWYFADAKGLRQYLRRDLGNVDPSRLDAIGNPKRHLKQLLGSGLYTAQISREIAASLDAIVVAERSPSFRGFVAGCTTILW